MHSFQYPRRRTVLRDVALARAAEECGTPLYVYSAGTILDHYRRLDAALEPLDHLICYAVKANSNGAILKLLAEAGAAFDIVSGGELFRVLRAGGTADKCTFAGVGKSREEMNTPSTKRFQFQRRERSGIGMDRPDRARQGCACADRAAGKPMSTPATHRYISTGRSENKFGIALHRVASVYEKAAQPRISASAGSKCTSARRSPRPPVRGSNRESRALIGEIKQRHALEFFSIGGGMGIIYRRALESGSGKWWHDHGGEESAFSVADYAKAIWCRRCANSVSGCCSSPPISGGHAGVLLTRVRYLKQPENKKFAIVDAGMNDLIRPRYTRATTRSCGP